MSRIGRMPITIPKGVDVKIDNGVLTAKGPKGQVSQPLFPGFDVAVEDGTLTVPANAGVLWYQPNDPLWPFRAYPNWHGVLVEPFVSGREITVGVLHLHGEPAVATPVIEIDCSIPLDAVNAKFVNVLKQMGPFGPENPRPVFQADNLFVFNSLSSFKDRHIKFLVGQQGGDRVFQAVGFDMAAFYEPISQGNPFRMAFTVEENVYNGTTSIQLRIKDIKF